MSDVLPPSTPAAGDNIDMAIKGELLEGSVQPSHHIAMIGAASYLNDLGIRPEIARDVLAGTHKVSQAEYDATKQWKADHLADKEFTDRYMTGDREARRKLLLADIILTGGVSDAPSA